MLGTNVETHAFGNFIPATTKYLILGSFTGKEAISGTSQSNAGYDWFYGTKRNQFWPIIEEVYGIKITTKQAKQDLLSRLGIALADIILQCERKNGSNLDTNLINIVYNKSTIINLVDYYPIEKIFFTSRFVEKKFQIVFKEIIEHHSSLELITLPSPSPRYVLITKDQKVVVYKELLPKLDLL